MALSFYGLLYMCFSLVLEGQGYHPPAHNVPKNHQLVSSDSQPLKAGAKARRAQEPAPAKSSGLATLATSTPRPTPTVSPTLTAIPEIAVDLILAANYFHPGDEFWLLASIRNPGQALPPFPLVVVLDLHGSYFLWPSWAPAPRYFDYEMIAIPAGVSRHEILAPFLWPLGVGSDEDIWFVAALLTLDFQELFGTPGAVRFDYGE